MQFWILQKLWLCVVLFCLTDFVYSHPRTTLRPRAYSTLDDEGIRRLVALEDPAVNAQGKTGDTSHQILDFNNPDSFLSSILIPRPPGSDALKTIRTKLKSEFENLGWDVEGDAFTDSTPIGKVDFENLIFTHNSSAPNKLVLAAHIDSKYFTAGSELDGFIGASDSAVPMALMLDLAKRIDPLLDAYNRQNTQHDEGWTTLQMIFFDGEEAFKSWSRTDSIYGARHLAEAWSQPPSTPSPAHAADTRLSQISAFVLLDLLGTPSPRVRSFYEQTGWIFDEFVSAEWRLGRLGLLWDDAQGDDWKFNDKSKSFFQERGMIPQIGHVEDDHLPFLARGVPIVHMIPTPFPSVWHKVSDNKEALDLPTIKAWGLILRTVVSEYLNLDPDSIQPQSNQRRNIFDRDFEDLVGRLSF